MNARHDSTPPSSLQAGRRTFLGNTAALMVMQAVKFLFPLVTLPYLARVLEPDAYAVRAYVVSYMVFIQTLIDFGFAQYGTKLIAENARDPQAMSSINTDVFVAKLLLALFGAAITLASAAFIPILGDNLAFVALSFGAIAAKSLLPDFVLQGLENMKAIAVRFSITQVIAVILIFLFVKEPSQLNLVAAFEGMASVVALAWTVAYLKRNYCIGIGRISASKTRKIIAGSTPFFISLAASALMSSTVTVLMGVFQTDALVISCWTIATTVIQGVQALWQPVTRSLFPHMVKRHDISLARKLLIVGTPIAIAIAAACHFAASWIVLVMGGEEYVAGSYILSYAALVLPFSYPIAVIGYPITGAIGRASELSACIGIAGGMQLVFLVAAGLAGAFSVGVALIARIGSEALLLVLETFVARRTIKRIRGTQSIGETS
ncbi:MAG: oligosaccharide flippase family protein [Adlercreutzia equolifaciens subsp. celatus]|uniref:oligosaccharide flippase family protein n=1 Tax=Adlercreutzia equolifaciens TaxID=446660 RepID=UPI0039928C03